MSVIFLRQNCNIDSMISAKDSKIGSSYQTPTGIIVQVVSKNDSKIIVKSGKTGNTIELSQDYKFKEIKMEETLMTEDTAPAVTTTNKEKRGKKSTIIDEGLKTSLSTDEIVQKILATYPDFPEKNIRNLISVRRSKFKKTQK